jgi:hypothetical protein
MRLPAHPDVRGILAIHQLLGVPYINHGDYTICV